MTIDYSQMTTEELQLIAVEVREELDRRTVLETTPRQIERLTRGLLDAEGAVDGGPWKETVLGYPVGYTVTYPLPDGSGSGTWVNKAPQNRYAPGSDGGGWKLLAGEEGSPPLWVRPAWAEMGYSKGDEVTFPTYEDGSVYRSLLDRNTWSPTDYPDGWELVEPDEEESDEEEPDGDIPVWVRPVWAAEEGGAYALGDQVRFPDENGPVYESTHDGWNTWAPDEYGWDAV